MRAGTQTGAWCNSDFADLPCDTVQPLPRCPGVTVTRVHKACAQDNSDPAGLLWLESSSLDANFRPGQPCSAWDYFFDRISMPVG
jgi:hypothetical protein